MMPCFGDDADFLTFQLEKGCLPIEGDESKHSVRLPLFLEQNAIYAHQHNHQCICPARALRALGLLLADSALTVGRGKTF